MSTKRDLREAIGSQNRDSLTIEYQLTKIKVFGYAFVILNIIQGMYILGFHCIQNEKVIIIYLHMKIMFLSWSLRRKKEKVIMH